MKTILNLLALAIIAGLAGVYFILGPSVFLGGPSKSEIVRVSRLAMEASAPSPEHAAAAKTATITPKGLCNSGSDGYACIVDVSVPGQTPTTFVSEMKKDATGVWVAAE